MPFESLFILACSSVPSPGKLITSPLSPLLKTQESSHEIPGVKVHLPPVPAHHSITTLPSSNNVQLVQHNKHSLAPDNPSKLNNPSKPAKPAPSDRPVAPPNPSRDVGKLPLIAPTSDKLPPLVNTAAMGRNGAGFIQAAASYDPTWPSAPTRPLPLHSQLKLTRRTSTFKATPLGYRPYPSRDRDKTDDEVTSLVAEDLSHVTLVEPEQATRVVFCKDDSSEAPILRSGEGGAQGQNWAESGNNGAESGRNVVESGWNGAESGQNGAESGQNGAETPNSVSAEQSAKSPTGGLDQEEQRAVVNQVERFERLMKVLSLLKNAGQTEDFGSSIGGVGDMQDLKEHIKLALDEAVQLRRETADMQSKIGVRGKESKIGCVWKDDQHRGEGEGGVRGKEGGEKNRVCGREGRQQNREGVSEEGNQLLQE